MTERVTTITRGDCQNRKGRAALAGALLLVATLAQAQVASAPQVSTSDPAFQAADSGYRAFSARRFGEATGHAQRAVQLRPAELPWHLLLIDAQIASGRLDAAAASLRQACERFPHEAALAERERSVVERQASARAQQAAQAVDADVAAGHLPDARAKLRAALADGSLDAMAPADAAYLALRAEDDASALQLFDRAAAAGPVSATVALDAGYTARRLNERRRAIAWFRQGLQAEGADALDPQRRFAIQRDIATLEQWWGGSAIVTNGPVGIAAGGLPSAAGRRQVTQAGGEVFLRPYDLQPRAGGTVEGFARYFQTLRDDGPGAVTGSDTGQASLGLRWRPWDETNVVFEVARLVKAGDVSRNDTQLRVAYSRDVGTDAPPTGSSWPGWRVYAEANRFLDTHLTVAAAEAQWGRMMRMGDDSSRTTLFPHLLLATSYDSSYARRTATSTGVGVTNRIPIGQPWGLAYAGWTLQYRVRLAGDEDRARGFFFQVFASF